MNHHYPAVHATKGNTLIQVSNNQTLNRTGSLAAETGALLTVCLPVRLYAKDKISYHSLMTTFTHFCSSKSANSRPATITLRCQLKANCWLSSMTTTAPQPQLVSQSAQTVSYCPFSDGQRTTYQLKRGSPTGAIAASGQGSYIICHALVFSNAICIWSH